MVSIIPVKRISGHPVYMYCHRANVFLYKRLKSVMGDWKPNVLRGYLEICAYSYLLRFKCIGNTIPILSFTMDKISYCKKGIIMCLKIHCLKWLSLVATND